MRMIVLLAVMSLPMFPAAITSTFDTNSEGWVVADDGPNNPVVYTSTGGHPGGAIQRTDLTDGYMHFQAPAAFLGNLSAYYDGTLSYDLLQTVADVDTVWFYRELLQGSNGLLILHTVGLPPDTTDWRHMSVKLDAAAGWIIIPTIEDFTGTPVTDAQFRSVLSNVTALYITGDLISGSDVATLDNVSLLSTPEPSALAFTALGLIGLLVTACCRARVAYR